MDAKLNRSDSLKFENRSKEILISLRKILRAITLHSKSLSKRYGLTGPQLVILNEIANYEGISVTQLAKSISLSQSTVTEILKRLLKKELVKRTQNEKDRRSVMIGITSKGNEILAQAPPALQEIFMERFENLAEWEQLMILSSIKRVVDLMAAEEIDAAPFLTADNHPK
jgi:DNA-binding MarR family transcriptional regulator